MESTLLPLRASFRPALPSPVMGLREDAEIISETPCKAQKHFIEANTKEVSLYHLKNECIVPVFSKDNEVTISHNAFIETVWECVSRLFPKESIASPEVRVSHIIKGRTPDAIHKAAHELTETDKTIYYERMAFCIEVPTISEDINGNRLNLTIGGVRAYNQENLYNRKTMEKFKVFIGFRNLVCCNLCVSTDGLCEEVRASNTSELTAKVIELIVSYNARQHLDLMASFRHQGITESRFAQLIGKMRLYQHLPHSRKKQLPAMLMTDTQINLVAKAYYQDKDFGVVGEHQELNLWNFYNLLTGANKSSYIDNFLERSLNATTLTEGISSALSGSSMYKWFIG